MLSRENYSQGKNDGASKADRVPPIAPVFEQGFEALKTSELSNTSYQSSRVHHGTRAL